MSAPAEFPKEDIALEPAEYLRLLGMLEDRMPIGTRAYLVSIDEDGRRRLTPVPDTSTVLDLKAQLVERLNGLVVADSEWLLSVRDCCNKRLAQQGVDLRPISVRQAGALIGQCAVLAHQICGLAMSPESEDGLEHLPLIETLSAQLGYQADLAAERLGEMPLRGGADDWLLPWLDSADAAQASQPNADPTLREGGAR